MSASKLLTLKIANIFNSQFSTICTNFERVKLRYVKYCKTKVAYINIGNIVEDFFKALFSFPFLNYLFI